MNQEQHRILLIAPRKNIISKFKQLQATGIPMSDRPERDNSLDVQPGTDEDTLRAAPVPEALNRNLRCCVPCKLVKTLEQFYEQGCENCTFLEMEGDRERIEDSTTTEFHVRISCAAYSQYEYFYIYVVMYTYAGLGCRGGP